MESDIEVIIVENVAGETLVTLSEFWKPMCSETYKLNSIFNTSTIKSFEIQLSQ